MKDNYIYIRRAEVGQTYYIVESNEVKPVLIKRIGRRVSQIKVGKEKIRKVYGSDYKVVPTPQDAVGYRINHLRGMINARENELREYRNQLDNTIKIKL